MTFKVGDRVTCVDPAAGSAGPQKGHTYTVKGVAPCTVENSGGFIMEVGDIGSWFSSRFVLATEAPKPHKWAKEIKAWADGAQIECRTKLNSGDWTAWCTLFQTPKWHTSTAYEYRIKPEKKPDRIRYAAHGEYFNGNWHKEQEHGDNIRATFDGETGTLKAVELIN